MQQCDEVVLNLMEAEEAAELLLRTGQIENVDAAAQAAAGAIAELCGRLPLCLSICGGVILAYDGDESWQTEVCDVEA